MDPGKFTRIADKRGSASANGPELGRRRVLLGLATGATAGLLPPAARAGELPAAVSCDGTAEAQSFYGRHQAGVVTPQPAAALVVSFDALARDHAELEQTFRVLTERIAFLMRGGPAETADVKFPPPDSGVLGPKVFPDNLTITVAVGASLFDDRYGLAAAKPAQLVSMEKFPNDALDANLCHGDILVQICSNTAETNIHALRDLVKHTPSLLAARWKIDGFLPPHTVRKLGKETVRNLLGFKDGTANLDASDGKLMDDIVWVGPEAGEPSWTAGGAYQVVRIIRMFVERWDRTALYEQQTIMGREKGEGAPLGLSGEKTDPDYSADPKGERIPMSAHIRLANPRTAETQSNRILRRGYNYSRGLSSSGQLDMGLLFVCFQASLTAGFLTVQSRLNGEPLEEYIKPIGGGYFFVLPGVRDDGSYLAEPLLRAAT